MSQVKKITLAREPRARRTVPKPPRAAQMRGEPNRADAGRQQGDDAFSRSLLAQPNTWWP